MARSPSSASRRAVSVTLTDAGHALVEATVRHLLEHEADLIASLEPPERATLNELLTKLEAASTSAPYQREWISARKYLSYSSSISPSACSLSGGRSPAAAFCLACAVLRAPGITVVTPGCWVAQRSAAWAVVGDQVGRR